jgi:putative membrane protein
LHPGTILDDALQRIPNVLIGLFLILTSGGGDAAFELIQLAIGLAAIFPVVVRYLTGRYRLGPDVVQWRMGVFTKVHTDLPRRRIQSVDTRISVVGRVLGLESVVISSAGGEGEIRIGLIDTATADMLRTELTPDAERPGPASGVVPSDVTAPVDDIELATLGASDLPRVIGVDVGRMLAIVGFGLFAAALLAGVVSGALGPGSLVFWLPSLLTVVGLGRGLLTEAIGFSSRLRGDRIRVARGILARSTFEAPLARVQGVTVKRSITARWLGMERISVDTADVSGEGSQAAGRNQTLVHPIAEQGTWRRWTPWFLRGAAPEPDLFRRVAPVSLRRRWFAVARFAIVVWLVAAVGAWLLTLRFDAVGLIRGVAVAVGILVPLALGVVETLRFRNERWALGDEQVAFVAGALTTTLVGIPRIRAQGALISANWFQRRLRVADLTVDTASPTVGGSGRDLHLADAETVARAVLASADAEGGV